MLTSGQVTPGSTEALRRHDNSVDFMIENSRQFQSLICRFSRRGLMYFNDFCLLISNVLLNQPTVE